ncbi:hypothetical protein OEZ85_013663 [Tetradesmus obliquus]|uniref:VWFA domain-containing protein n=1 Tax=Tetradesmus obliquus TaxID=3088 RepID=A0ABY8UUR4_TETOB|nr:hypothetical protein OEZ85_013663 [Tetradesmus obliquus]
MQFVKDVVSNLSSVSSASLFGASQFASTARPIDGLENLSSDVPYILSKLDANTFDNGATATDGGIRQCYEKLPGGGSTGILTRGLTDPTLPRMIIMLTDGSPTRREFETFPNDATCPCSFPPGAPGPVCVACSKEAATKRANEAAIDGVVMVSIGVGSAIDSAWLSSISTFYNVSDFSKLQSLVETIVGAACADIDVAVGCTSSPMTAPVGGKVSTRLDITNGGIYNYLNPLSFSVVTEAAGLQGLVVTPSTGSPPATCVGPTTVNIGVAASVYNCTIAVSGAGPLAPGTPWAYDLKVNAVKAGTWGTIVQVFASPDNNVQDNKRQCMATVQAVADLCVANKQ